MNTVKVAAGRLGLSEKTVYTRHKPRGKPTEDVRYNRAFSRRRIVVEHALARLRRFRAVANVTRHRRKGHAARVRACAGLVNRMLDHRSAT